MNFITLLILILIISVGNFSSLLLLGSHTCGQSIPNHNFSLVRELSSQRTYGTHLSRCLVCQRCRHRSHPSPNPNNSGHTCANCPNWSNLAFLSWSNLTKSTTNNTRQPTCLVCHWNHPALFASKIATCLVCPYRSDLHRRGSWERPPPWRHTQRETLLLACLRKHHLYFCIKARNSWLLPYQSYPIYSLMIIQKWHNRKILCRPRRSDLPWSCHLHSAILGSTPPTFVNQLPHMSQTSPRSTMRKEKSWHADHGHNFHRSHHMDASTL